LLLFIFKLCKYLNASSYFKLLLNDALILLFCCRWRLLLCGCRVYKYTTACKQSTTFDCQDSTLETVYLFYTYIPCYCAFCVQHKVNFSHSVVETVLFVGQHYRLQTNYRTRLFVCNHKICLVF